MGLADTALEAADGFAELTAALGRVSVSAQNGAAAMAAFSVGDVGGGLISHTFDEFPAQREFFLASVREAVIAGGLLSESPGQRAFFEAGAHKATFISKITTGENIPIHPPRGF